MPAMIERRSVRKTIRLRKRKKANVKVRKIKRMRIGRDGKTNCRTGEREAEEDKKKDKLDIEKKMRKNGEKDMRKEGREERRT